MTDDNKFTIKVTHFSKLNLTDLPEISHEQMDAVRNEVARAFAVQAEKIWLVGDKPSSHYHATSTLRENFFAEQALTKEKLEEIIDKFLNPQRALERRLRDAILNTLEEAGLHPDNVERVEFALQSTIGTEAMKKLTLDEVKDIEHLAQKFLQIYRDITK